MTAIISREIAPGVFPEVGMNDRVITSYKQEWRIRRIAREFAKDRACRIEYYVDKRLLGPTPPRIVIYKPGEV